MKQGGFTLIEITVTMSIIGIMSAIIMVAYPASRDNQSLLSAKQQIQGMLQDSLQRAMNDTRDPGCVAALSPADQGRCSNIGIALTGNKIIMFADQDNIGKYNFASNGAGSAEIKRAELAGGVQVVADNWILFNGDHPPNVLTSWGDDQISLRGGTHVKELQVLPYGKLK